MRDASKASGRAFVLNTGFVEGAAAGFGVSGNAGVTV